MPTKWSHLIQLRLQYPYWKEYILILWVQLQHADLGGQSLIHNRVFSGLLYKNKWRKLINNIQDTRGAPTNIWVTLPLTLWHSSGLAEVKASVFFTATVGQQTTQTHPFHYQFFSLPLSYFGCSHNTCYVWVSTNDAQVQFLLKRLFLNGISAKCSGWAQEFINK